MLLPWPRPANDPPLIYPSFGLRAASPGCDRRPTLGEAERTIWTGIVTACAARALRGVETRRCCPRYVQNVVLAQQAAALEREGAVDRRPAVAMADRRRDRRHGAGGAVHAAADLATGAAAARDDGADCAVM